MSWIYKLLSSVALCSVIFFTSNAQTTIVGWNFFSSGTSSSGIPANTGTVISTTGTGSAPFFSGVGCGFQEAICNNFGLNDTWVSTSFSTVGYTSVTYSFQHGSFTGGPTAFKFQYSLNGSTWVDVVGPYATPVSGGCSFYIATDVAMPAAVDNQGAVYIRWICTTAGGTGGNRLAEVTIKGTATCTDPTVPTVTGPGTSICPGSSTTLSISGTLNDATAWSVYSGSCGGTFLGTTATSSFTVNPGSSTTYFIRGEGGCVTPGSCGSVTVNVITTPDADSDGSPDLCDSDDDNDGVADVSDPSPLDPDICGDADGDGCDDCIIGTDNFGPLPDNTPSNDGTDTDSDGICDTGDPDDDNDGVADVSDPSPLNPNVCGDADSDGCDDCSVGTDGFGPLADNTPSNDGADTDGDGICDTGDSDDDNDGVTDGSDPSPLDPSICGDADADGCDDCSVGTDGFGPLTDNTPANDGMDTDGDGICDSGDADDDNDGVADVSDPSPLNPFVCGDSDGDTCDDCSVGTDGFGPLVDSTPANDGTDTDGDGICDSGDNDDDNDGVADFSDFAPLNPNICEDADGDGCDDCTVGTDGFGPLTDNTPANDGVDTDGDGLCDSGDTDDDNDGVADVSDPDPLNPNICGDANTDGCDDCAVGTDDFGPLADNIGDLTPPTAVCQNITAFLDGAGNVTITAGDVDGGSSDNCSFPSLSASPTSFTCADLGANNVTLTATDASSNSSSCVAVVTVADTTSPIITCPGTQLGAVGATCTFSLPDYTGLASTTDNCGFVTVTQSPSPGTAVSEGTTIVTLTATDGSANTNSCSFNVEVSGAAVSFTASSTDGCINTTYVFTDASPGAVSWNWDFGDGNTSTLQNPSNLYQTVGSFDVTLAITDGNGCTGSSTVVGAATVNPPKAAFTANPTNGCAIPHTVFFTDQSTLPDTWFWDFGDGNTSTAQNPIHSYTSYGSFTVTLTTTDTIFGCSDQAQTTIDVQDVTPPSVTCPGNQNENADASCSVSLPDYTGMSSATDLCDASPVITQSPTPGTVISGLGTVQLVKIYAQDAAGNIDSCSFDVTVVDNTIPTAVCQNISAYLDGAGNVTVLPADIDNGSSDNCSINTMTINGGTNAVYSCSDIGAQNATLEVFDISGNSTTCFSTITVVDTISPTASCQNITTYLDGVGNVTITAADIDGGSSDNCTVSNLSASTTAFTCADIGSNSVTLTVVDQSSNTKSCVAVVTVADTISPVITCPGTQTVNVGATCEFTLPDYTSMATVSDNCNGSPSITQSPIVGTVVSTTTTITLTADDGNGNTSTCTFDVVLNDATAPVAVCQDINVYLDGAGNATIVGADVDGGSSDNCAVQSLVVSPNTFTCVNLGANAVTLTVTDASSNQDNCTATVTVLDTVSPSITCPAGQTGLVDAACSFALLDYTSMATVSDNCSGAPIVTQSPVAGTSVGVGVHTIVLTADDGNGNTSSCSFVVTVSDNIAPVITCPNDQSDFYDASCSFTLLDYTSLASASDNCGAPTISQSPMVGTVVTSSTLITLTVDDGNGNSTNCSFNVMLSDSTAPVVNCPSDETIYLDASCEAVLPDYTLSGNIFDNCDPSVSIVQTPMPGELYDAYEILEVSLVATDISGNVDSCMFFVTVDADENSGCVENLVVSNLISPNGDGKNDYWIIHEPTYIIGCDVLVYNRWGQKVFEAQNYDNTWDGTYQGKPLPDGAYYYVIQCDGEVKYKGDISILRLTK